MNDKIIRIDDLPFDLNAQESEFLMSKIPKNISAIGLQWGYDDTVFKDNLFEYIVKNILHFEDIDKYYESDVCKKYLEKGELLANSILIGDVKQFRICFDSVFYNKQLEETGVHHGSFESVSIDLDTAKRNAFFELAKIVLKDGFAVKKLEITKIEEI